MSDRIPPVDLPQGTHVLAMIGNTYCVRARVGTDVNWNFVAEPTLHFKNEIRKRIDLLPWRYLDARDEGIYWVRGWSRRHAAALKVAAALDTRAHDY